MRTVGAWQFHRVNTGGRITVAGHEIPLQKL